MIKLKIDLRFLILGGFLFFLIGFGTGLAAHDYGWRLNLKPLTDLVENNF